MNSVVVAVASWPKQAVLAITLATAFLISAGVPGVAQQQQKPNIVIIWGDDIGQSNISAYSRGMMGYQTPNIDRVAGEGIMFTDYYAEQSCTAGRSSFITGQSGLRTGLTKVGLPGAAIGLQKEDPTIAELLKPLGYATGQFGKNHFGDLNKYLPTVHGFDEFYGNLYHLNAEEEPEQFDYPHKDQFPRLYELALPRGVMDCKALDEVSTEPDDPKFGPVGKQTITEVPGSAYFSSADSFEASTLANRASSSLQFSRKTVASTSSFEAK